MTRRALILLLLLLVERASAAPAPWADGRSRGEDLTVKLVTIEPGSPIYSWWGHSAIIVEDTRLKASRFYNYGLFSFEQENFLLNFMMGRLWFQVGAAPVAAELASYKAANRTIRIMTLDLVPQKRQEMARFLERNILPANRNYLYDHYLDNCATRVRDLIDRTVDGQLAAATAGNGRMSLRQHTRRFTAGHFFMNWLLLFLMSGGIDRPISRWAEMFLPMELERNVRDLAYIDPEGRSRRLASEEILYYQARIRKEVPVTPPACWPQALGIGLGLGLAALGLAFWRRRGENTPRLLSGIYESLLGFTFGLLGSVLFFMSLFTDHTVTYANRNLFLASPLTLAVLPLGVALAAGARGTGRWLVWLWSLLCALSLASLALQLVPAIRQDNWPALALLLPAQAGCAAGWLASLRPRRS